MLFRQGTEEGALGGWREGDLFLLRTIAPAPPGIPACAKDKTIRDGQQRIQPSRCDFAQPEVAQQNAREVQRLTQPREADDQGRSIDQLRRDVRDQKDDALQNQQEEIMQCGVKQDTWQPRPPGRTNARVNRRHGRLLGRIRFSRSRGGFGLFGLGLVRVTGKPGEREKLDALALARAGIDHGVVFRVAIFFWGGGVHELQGVIGLFDLGKYTAVNALLGLDLIGLGRHGFALFQGLHGADAYRAGRWRGDFNLVRDGRFRRFRLCPSGRDGRQSQQCDKQSFHKWPLQPVSSVRFGRLSKPESKRTKCGWLSSREGRRCDV